MSTPASFNEPTIAASAAWRRRSIAAGAALALMTVIVYLPVGGADFIWDDETYITGNEALRSRAGLWHTWFDVTHQPQYYPLVHSSFWVEYHLWGLAPLGYHVVNIALHIVNAILLWRLLLRLQVPGAWLAAAIFAVHPVEVETVAWITERKNLLSLALALGSLLAYFRFAPPNAPTIEDGSQTRRATTDWYLLALALFAGALLSKTVVVTLPAVVLVIVWWKRGRIALSDIWPLLPFFALGIALSLLTVWLEKYRVGAVGSDFDFTPLQRVLMAGRALCFYVGKLVWPHPLVFFYPSRKPDTHDWTRYVYVAAVLATFLALWMARHRIGRGPLAATLIFAGVMFPALGFFNVYPMKFSLVADHFQYHASTALIALGAAALATAAVRLPAARSIMPLAAGALLVALGAVAFAHARTFDNLEVLYRDVIRKNPDSHIAYSNLAAVLREQGKRDEALRLSREALRLHPNEPEIEAAVGWSMFQVDDTTIDPTQLDEAIAHLKRAVKLAPKYTDARAGLASALILAKRPAEAREQFALLLEERPDDLNGLYGVGWSLAAEGKPAEAIPWFEKLLAKKPDFAKAQLELGLALMNQQRYTEAIDHLEKTMQLGGESAEVCVALGDACSKNGEYRRALEHYRYALTIEPNHVEAACGLGAALLELGDPTQAVKVLRQALDRDPGSAKVQALFQRALQAQPQSK